jgi:catechol 2,3-dioxygenase-like lactoylglutathione lyase family enzyme
MLDHISLRVQDLPRALAFYRAALAPIGYDVIMEFPDTYGLGANGKPDLWIMRTEQQAHPTHLAFVSKRDRIDAFHSAALAAGAVDNGGPGLRAHYHPHYYSAFVLDPEGNNIEVVCHEDPSAPPPAPPPRPAAVRASAKRAARKPAKRAARKPSKAASKKSSAKKPAKSAAKGKKKRR